MAASQHLTPGPTVLVAVNCPRLFGRNLPDVPQERSPITSFAVHSWMTVHDCSMKFEILLKSCHFQFFQAIHFKHFLKHGPTPPFSSHGPLFLITKGTSRHPGAPQKPTVTHGLKEAILKLRRSESWGYPWIIGLFDGFPHQKVAIYMGSPHCSAHMLIILVYCLIKDV